MGRKLGALCLAFAVCAAGWFTAEAQEKKTDKGATPPGAVVGKVKSVDADKDTLTITTADGRTRTFIVNDSTTMVGPRGGQVPRRLKDPRFHEGLDVTVIPSGKVAKEIQLGYDRAPADEKPAPKETKTKAPAETKVREPAPAKKAAAADEEFSGKVKSVDPEKRLLVVTLADGKDRSFMLATATPVQVKGKAAKDGLSDPTIKPGASVKVVTEPGGRKVKEVSIMPPASSRTKKAG